MAPLRQLMAIGLACCMAASTVAAQEDTPAPILISGFDGGAAGAAPVLLAGDDNSESDPLAPVFLPGVVLDNSEGDAAAPADAGDATENVLLANGSGADAPSDEPIFLPGVFLDGSNSGETPAPSMTPASTPASPPSGPTPAPILLADDNASTAPTPVNTPPLGGWFNQPAGDNEIAFLVSALSDIKLYNPSLSFGVCMKDVFGLQYQSVAGTNFRFSGHGCLIHKGAAQMGACTTACAFEKLQVTIYTQPSTNVVQVNNIARIE